MEPLTRAIDKGLECNDQRALAQVFGASSLSTLGQGEQKALAGYFVKSVVNKPGFLPVAFSSPELMGVFQHVLANLPSNVDGAADSKLRQLLFEYKVNEEDDYSGAARVLAGIRMEDDLGSSYFMAPEQKTDVYVKIAECFLEEDETVEADGAVTKAGQVVESIEKPEDHMALILRYKSTYARVLDANRKFLQAASRYHDLSQSATDLIEADDLLSMLGRAATCAVLAPSGPQRHRILGKIYNDERLNQLDAMDGMSTHSTILKKMYLSQVIQKQELTKFEQSLADHQRATMADGNSIIDRAVIEHNMIAISKIYKSIYMANLARILSTSEAKAERLAANMIMDKSIRGSIDQVEGIVIFEAAEPSDAAWDRSITAFCGQVSQLATAIKSEA
uniref:COP9 signalosome complex subunit 4 n=1 Tax=Grammatophora oceanica TaxID=210454 RepID=A0A7S1VCP8_9STRA|mmetsp:Transcript_43088/g.63913  ORF Transcript_43088/g.63913 Transcript_43088/m.63913 type:complete len:392 (+) Transcript_43088:88-1263(+)